MTKTPIHPRSPLGVFELHHKPTGNDNLQHSINLITLRQTSTSSASELSVQRGLYLRYITVGLW